MYVCMYVCMYVWMDVCMDVCMHQRVIGWASWWSWLRCRYDDDDDNLIANIIGLSARFDDSSPGLQQHECWKGRSHVRMQLTPATASKLGKAPAISACIHSCSLQQLRFCLIQTVGSGCLRFERQLDQGFFFPHFAVLGSNTRTIQDGLSRLPRFSWNLYCPTTPRGLSCMHLKSNSCNNCDSAKSKPLQA